METSTPVFPNGRVGTNECTACLLANRPAFPAKDPLVLSKDPMPAAPVAFRKSRRDRSFPFPDMSISSLLFGLLPEIDASSPERSLLAAQTYFFDHSSDCAIFNPRVGLQSLRLSRRGCRKNIHSRSELLFRIPRYLNFVQEQRCSQKPQEEFRERELTFDNPNGYIVENDRLDSWPKIEGKDSCPCSEKRFVS